MTYIKDAKEYYKVVPFDWINKTFKATGKESKKKFNKGQKKGLLKQIPPREYDGLEGIRTPGQSVKSRLLYLAELQAQEEKHMEKQERLFRLNDTKLL